MHDYKIKTPEELDKEQRNEFWFGFLVGLIILEVLGWAAYIGKLKGNW